MLNDLTKCVRRGATIQNSNASQRKGTTQVPKEDTEKHLNAWGAVPREPATTPCLRVVSRADRWAVAMVTGD